MKKTCLHILTILYIIGIMIFIWAIDISTGAIWRENRLTNGFQHYDPMQIYHIGLWGVIIISFLFAVIVIYALAGAMIGMVAAYFWPMPYRSSVEISV